MQLILSFHHSLGINTISIGNKNCLIIIIDEDGIIIVAVKLYKVLVEDERCALDFQWHYFLTLW